MHETLVHSNVDIKENLKPDHAMRPIWVATNGYIFMENVSGANKLVQEFLTTIAEPVSRPKYIHEYRITPYSLYAAVSIGINPTDIVNCLNRLSKNYLSRELIDFIKGSTVNFGKVKLVLRDGRFWLETSDPVTMQKLLKDNIILDARCSEISTKKVERQKHAVTDAALQELLFEERTSTFTDDCYYVEINSESVEKVKKRCIELEFPVLEEYDYLNDSVNPNTNIELRSSTIIRPYQEKALEKLICNGRARSGIIVLPCGAGKTLVGIVAACSIRKSVLILCTSAVAAEQWRQQFKMFTNISDNAISLFTSDQKEKFIGKSGVIVSTYTMIAYTGKRSYDAKRVMQFIESVEWGLLILDEVHVVPANVFRKVLTNVAAHSKLGLTATLVREDEKIEDLNFLIGPKLYEANWQDLAQQGHIANVQCAEVWCPMTQMFYREYLLEKTRRRRLLYVMNPKKFQICQYLIDFHEKRGDKIIVFSDNVYALKAYALKLQRPYIYGPTSQYERMQVLQKFQSDSNLNTIFLSKVGDTSIDLPEATCLIQISSHYGSRRQEAQRLGRILRAKKRFNQAFNAYFYSLVSKDTEEMYYSTKRQQFLIDQGYSFKTITEFKDIDNHPGLVYSTKEDQTALLREVLLTNEIDAEDEDMSGFDVIEELEFSKTPVKMSDASGAGEMAYFEENQRRRVYY